MEVLTKNRKEMHCDAWKVIADQNILIVMEGDLVKTISFSVGVLHLFTLHWRNVTGKRSLLNLKYYNICDRNQLDLIWLIFVLQWNSNLIHLSNRISTSSIRWEAALALRIFRKMLTLRQRLCSIFDSINICSEMWAPKRRK